MALSVPAAVVAADPANAAPAARPPHSWRSQTLRVLGQVGGWFPFTAVGVAVLVVALTAGWYEGLGHADMVLLMVSFCGLVAMAVLLLLVVIGTWVTHRVFRQPMGRTSTRLEAEVEAASGFAVRFPAWLPLLDVSWRWDGGPGTCPATTSLHKDWRDTYEVVRPQRRGLYHRIVRRVQVRDILGLCSVSWQIEEPIELRVLPHRGKVEQLIPMIGFVPGEDVSDPFGDPWGDRVDMRQYTPGDSPRMIMWKVFARSRKLMVRVNERAISARPRGCGYLVSDLSRHPADEASAGIARIVVERGLLGEGWEMGADNGGLPASHINEALDVIARSGVVTHVPLPWVLRRRKDQAAAAPSTGFGDFLKRVEGEGFGYCVLFLPPRPGPWLDAVAQYAQSSRLRIHVMIGLDGLASELDQIRRRDGVWRRLVLAPDNPDCPTLSELSQVVSRMSNCSADVCLIDRASGQIFTNPMSILQRSAKLNASPSDRGNRVGIPV